MPAHRHICPNAVILRRLRGPPPRGAPRTVRSLAMVAEVVHGAPCRFADSARFSLVAGGEDRRPYPVPLTVYDKTIDVLKSAVARSKLGNDDKLDPAPAGCASY